MSQAAGQVNILIFLLKIKFSPCMPINFVMQGKCLFSDISRPGSPIDIMSDDRDRKGRFFLSHPHTKNRFVFLLTIKYHIFIFQKRLREVYEYAEMPHKIIVSLQHNNDVTYLWICSCSFFYSYYKLVRGMGDRAFLYG